MPKFFIKNEDIKGQEIFIKDDDFKHMKNVLRMKVGEHVYVSDEEQNSYECEIAEFQKEQAKLSILNIENDNVESPLSITLYQAIPKGDKMEYIIQKNTELGINRIIPITTERVIVKLDESTKKKKIERWQKIANEASKQSRRTKIPLITNIMDISQIYQDFEQYDLIILPYECERDNNFKASMKNLKKMPQSIAVIIGAEGGFTYDETEKLRTKNSNIISLGPRILRTETAGIVVNSILMYEFGDIG